MPLTDAEKKFLAAHRVAHLASADARGRPHVVPICYVCDDSCLYSVVDAKPKRVPAAELKRLRNVRENPRVAVVVDTYDEDWTRLAYLLIHGTARIIGAGPEHAHALGLLRAKYPQYRTMRLDDAPMLCVAIERVIGWKSRGS